MRIGLEITGALAGGGYRRYVECLLQAFARLAPEHEYFLYGAFWRGFPDRAMRLALPRQKNFHWALKKYPQSLLLPLEEYSGIRLQERFLSSLRLDILHGLGSFVPRLNRLRSMVTLHYSGWWDFKGAWDKFYFNRLTPRSLQQAQKVIAISEFARQEALKSWRLPADKVVTIHHGGPDSRFKPASESRDPRPDLPRPYFLFVGTVGMHKNPALLAQAFGIMKTRHPQWPHRLVFAGPAGDQTERIKDILRDQGLLNQAVFLGSVDPDSIYMLYQQAEAVVCPSLTEGFAIPVLEAMACGVPVVGVRAGALEETIGDAGLLAEPSPEALAAEMLRLLKEKDLREDLRNRGLQWARKFSWEETAKKTLRLYEEVVRGAC